MRLSRNVDIMADAAYEILTKDSKTFTGNFCIDDLVLHEAGVTDFSQYANVPMGSSCLTSSFLMILLYLMKLKTVNWIKKRH